MTGQAWEVILSHGWSCVNSLFRSQDTKRGILVSPKWPHHAVYQRIISYRFHFWHHLFREALQRVVVTREVTPFQCAWNALRLSSSIHLMVNFVSHIRESLQGRPVRMKTPITRNIISLSSWAKIHNLRSNSRYPHQYGASCQKLHRSYSSEYLELTR